MKAEGKKPAVFLDRDGTINEEVSYLDRMEKLRLIPGAADAIRRLNAAGFSVVVVTNQSGVARGFFDEAFVLAVNERLRQMLQAEGARIDAVYYCPHHPTEGKGKYLRACGCRKPAPGLLLAAVSDFGIDPARSYMVGDMLTDVEAGNRAGVRAVLVRTGLGGESAARLGAAGAGTEARPARIAADLSEAADWILDDAGGRAR